MLIRALDEDNDWTFGKGRNNYKKDGIALLQDIETRLKEFLGDCFFNLTAGIDWFNLLGNKDQTALNLAISTVILNTPAVTGLLQLLVSLDPVTRNFLVRYVVQTSYSPLSGQLTFTTDSL